MTFHQTHFSYVDGDGDQHEVWYENGRSATTKFYLGRRYYLGGIELWRMGGEDPSVTDRDGIDGRLRRVHRDDRARRVDRGRVHARSGATAVATRSS